MYNIIFRLLLVPLALIPISVYSDVPREGFEIIKERAKLPILTPSLEQRKTQKIRLNNQLEVYLISDPAADLNGAMMSVKVGSWEDPEQHPGLAHFLEHMLFLGTQKYPEESGYQRFITEHGGQTNAFTSDNSTNYLFTVSNRAFPEALDRFSSFFKEPLFNPSGVAREMHAIDQEFAKNLEHDSIRQIHVLKELADPHHPYHNFTMGRSDTLKQASRENLEEWFRSRYSANLMKLVVYTSLPIEEARELVVSQFSGIPNKDRQPFSVHFPAFKPQVEKKYVYIEPIKDTRTLTLVWELPGKFSHQLETKPEHIISYILGHEGDKSLLAQLKREKLVEKLSSGSAKMGDDLTMVYLELELTNEGLKDVNQVISRVFQTIRKLQERGIPSYVFDEIKQMATTEYQFQAEDNEFLMLMEHAYQIQEEDMSTYPEHTEVIQQFDPGGVQELLASLSPQNAQYLIMAPSKHTGVKYDRKEKWLGVQYTLRPIGKDVFEKWSRAAAHEEIDIPAPNIFIPDNLKLVYDKVVPSDSLVPEPILLVQNEGASIYFAHDDRFGLPKICWTITILTPEIAMKDPLKMAFADLYVKSLKDSLSKISYPAKLAELSYQIERKDNGVAIKIEGYSQNAPRLLDSILSTISNYQPEMTKFRQMKDSLSRKYQNFSKEKPIEQSIEIFKSLLYRDFVSENEKAIALRKATFKQYSDYVDTIFAQTYIQGMFFGNMTEGQTRLLATKLKETFNKGVYAEGEHFKKEVIVLPQTEGPYFVEDHTLAQGNAVLLAIENITFSFKERAAQQILTQAIQEPFFNSLRTKQQTGYIVHAFCEEVERKLFNLFAVQSNTHDGRDLLSRFEQFIEGYLQELGRTELDEKQFENIKKALVEKLKTPAKNVDKMGELLNTLAFEYEGDFAWVDKRIDGFDTLSYHEFIDFSKSLIGRANKRRLAILLNGQIPEEHAFSYTRARTKNALRKVSEYQYR